VIALETFRADAGIVALLNPDNRRIEIEVEHALGCDPSEIVLRPGQGITGWVALHGKPRLVADVAAEPRYLRIRAETRSVMAVPITEVAGHVLGVVTLYGDRIGAFSQKDLDLFDAMGAEASAVMRRLWQLHHLQGKAKQLEALTAIGQSLVTKLEPQELFDSITRNARQVTRSGACALYLHDPVNRTLRCVSFAGEAGLSPVTEELPLDVCLNASVIHTHKPAEFASIRSPDFADLSDLPRDPELQSVLATPLLFGGEAIGVLTVFTATVHRFDNDEKRLCTALARLAAVTVENARLYARVFQSEELLRKNEQLTTLGLLAAEIAHEIRNPLTVIKLLHGSLGLDFPEGDPRRTDTRLIGEKLDQLEAIVSRVLSFAKAPGTLHSRWAVANIVEETLLLIRLKLAQSKIQLVYNPPPLALVVDVNKGQIQQVLLNLLLNSTQAMPDGGIITVSIREEEREGAPIVQIDVSDNGPGIPEPIRGRIFDSFLSGRPDGTGLGLAIAKRILIGHHGDISLVSSGPDGTTLRLSLPLARG